jgi:hypothetical protein
MRRSEVTNEKDPSIERGMISVDRFMSHCFEDGVGEMAIHHQFLVECVEIEDACNNEKEDETEESAVDGIQYYLKSRRSAIDDIDGKTAAQ